MYRNYVCTIKTINSKQALMKLAVIKQTSSLCILGRYYCEARNNSTNIRYSQNNEITIEKK